MSQAIIELQKKIGVVADGDFGPASAKAFQSHFKLNKNKCAHFLGQCAHETGGFSVFSENLNYSAEGLTKTFKKYFPTVQSTSGYARNPERIANRVYGNRLGNGPESSGDGWKYRGRGAIQLTGKENYIAFSRYVNDPSIVSNPDLVSTKYAFESAMFFFTQKGLWSICDRGVTDEIITMISKYVNGGTNGLSDRIVKTKKFHSLLV